MPVKPDKPPPLLLVRQPNQQISQPVEAMMPMFLSDRNRRLRLGFQFGRQSGLRSTNEVIEQLQRQIAAERAQRVFNAEQMHKEVVKLLRENAELRLDIARRDREAAFARFEDPLATRH